MNRLTNYTFKLDLISGRIFEKVFQFFSEEHFPSRMEPDKYSLASRQIGSGNQFEWSLNQDYSDIYNHDLGILFRKITPKFIADIFNHGKMHLLIFFCLDEATDEGDPSISEQSERYFEFTDKPKIIYIRHKADQFTLNCYRWFNRRIELINHLSVKWIRASFHISVCPEITPFTNDCIFLNMKHHRNYIRGPGISKLITRLLYHKRI